MTSKKSSNDNKQDEGRRFRIPTLAELYPPRKGLHYHFRVNDTRGNPIAKGTIQVKSKLHFMMMQGKLAKEKGLILKPIGEEELRNTVVVADTRENEKMIILNR